MNTKLNEKIGSVEHDGLIYGAWHTDVVTVTLTANIGIVKRGTLVNGTLGSPLSPIKSALSVSMDKYIIAEDVDTSVTTKVSAYRTGHFARNKIITDNYTLVPLDEELLRNCGILLSDAIEA